MKNIHLLYCIVLILSCGAPEVPTEYIIAEKDFVPEGIAYSKTTDAFYLTSVAKSKILKVDRISGQQTDFIGSHEHGYSPGAGILVDDDRNILYAIGGYYMTDDSLSSLYAFDLQNSSLIARYNVEDEGGHFLNDMIMDDTGNMYLTDSKDSSVYILKSGTNRLERFIKSAEITFPNGIAISDDQSKLYVASIPNGVRILDLNTKEFLNATDTTNRSKGIDGLEFYNDNLYGVQNSARGNPFNVRKLILNTDQDKIIDHEVIVSDNPPLDVPLTFCIAQQKAVIIANSNLQHLNQVTFTFNDTDSVRPTKLLTYPVD